MSHIRSLRLMASVQALRWPLSPPTRCNRAAPVGTAAYASLVTVGPFPTSAVLSYVLFYVLSTSVTYLDSTRHSLNRHQVTPQFLFGHTQSHEIPCCSLTHGEIRTAQSGVPRSFDLSPTLHLSQPHDVQSFSDSHGMPANPMAPPSKPRKRKAPTLRADVWEPYRLES